MPLYIVITNIVQFYLWIIYVGLGFFLFYFILFLNLLIYSCKNKVLDV